MTETNAELIAAAREWVMPRSWMNGTACLIDELANALEAATLTATEDALYIKRMEAERDAALAVISSVAAVIAKLARDIDNPEDISEYWREAFDATDDIEDILTKAAK